jgi:hypothetical protein
MLPIVACSLPFVHLVANIAQQASRNIEDAQGEAGNQVVKFRHPACGEAGADGIIVGGHAAARATVTEPVSHRAGASRSVV